jgi:hypothetical protein
MNAEAQREGEDRDHKSNFFLFFSLTLRLCVHFSLKQCAVPVGRRSTDVLIEAAFAALGKDERSANAF